jgi:large subunit ribosomal protein L6
MSRVGKKPIPLPKGVKITIGNELLVEGPKGKQTVPIPAGITIRQENGVVELQRDADNKAALHGLTRALAANALGYSHPIEFYLPDGIDMTVDKPANNLTPLILTGSDKQVLGQVAAKMRALRPPDPYKNKGIRYVGELLRKKVGKTGASGGK